MTVEDAKLAISNFRTYVTEKSIEANTNKNTGKEYTSEPEGAGAAFLRIVDDYADMYGEQVTAEALERVRERMDLESLHLYYIARDGSEADYAQEEAEAEFSHFMEEFILEMLVEAEPEEPSDEYGEEWDDLFDVEEPEEYTESKPEIPKPGKSEKAKTRRLIIDQWAGLPKKALKEEYYKARRRLQDAINRRKKSGIDVGFEIPGIPKKITAGSIRKLEKLLTRVKREHRYLAWKKGYRK